MNYPPQLLRLDTRILSQSEEIRNVVKIRVHTVVEEYIRDRTGFQTLTASYESSPPRLIEFSLPSANLRQINDILCRHRLSPQLSLFLAVRISPEATKKGLGVNSFVMTLLVKLTYKRVSAFNFDFSTLPSSIGGEAVNWEDDVVERLIREGAIDKERSKSLNLGSEACSICFESLVGTSDKAPTQISCSHVFHDRCISQWLRRKNSCPLCRRELYGR
ncbi:unnamed protein product [Microthlaspi erraticum]|uniref:RING-type domain-containing protein n=1 Tax=Microthlaspi erraticum TaxID=1685480 RepID=A0A6D2KQ64_9BRAS|nr:unnamed protein product [Microthlaspi erraticum]